MTIAKVTISNICTATAHHRLGEQHDRGRRLAAAAAAAVDFDTSISVANTTAAIAMTTTVKDIAPATLKTQFMTQLQAVKDSGDFADVASIDITALVSDVTVVPQTAAIETQAVTAAPTPAGEDAGTGKGGAGTSPVLPVAGAAIGCVLVTAVAFAFVIQKRRSAMTKASVRSSATLQDDGGGGGGGIVGVAMVETRGNNAAAV